MCAHRLPHVNVGGTRQNASAGLRHLHHGFATEMSLLGRWGVPFFNQKNSVRARIGHNHVHIAAPLFHTGQNDVFGQDRDEGAHIGGVKGHRHNDQLYLARISIFGVIFSHSPYSARCCRNVLGRAVAPDTHLDSLPIFDPCGGRCKI